MRKTGKLLSAVLALALVLCLLPMTALAEDKNANWQALQTAMMGGEQTTVEGVFTVTDVESTRTITLLADITAGANDTRLEVKSTSNGGKTIILDLNGKTLDRGLTGKTANRHGNVIYNNGGTLTIQDTSEKGNGKITGGNCDESGGGVYNNYGTITMTGGIITGNTAGMSGGVQNAGTTATFTMTGGIITGNSLSRGNGGGVNNVAKLYLGGTAVVMGNKSNGSANDVVNGSNSIYIDSTVAPADGMYVGLLANNTKILNATDGQEKYFFADEAGKCIKFDTDKLKIVAIPDNTINYKITLSYNPELGYITAPQYAASGDVEVKVNPAEGYQLKSLTVTPDEGETKDITEQDGKYKFEMGDKAVTVTAEFEKIPTAPIEPLTPATIDFTAISRIVKGVIGLIGFKKTTDDVKTVSILATIFRVITQLLDQLF